MPSETHLKSGLIDSVSPILGDIRCDWKNRLLSLWPNELLIFGVGSLKWLNGSDTLNIFVWLFGLKLFIELPGIFTGADAPCKIPVNICQIQFMCLVHCNIVTEWVYSLGVYRTLNDW